MFTFLTHARITSFTSADASIFLHFSRGNWDERYSKQILSFNIPLFAMKRKFTFNKLEFFDQVIDLWEVHSWLGSQDLCSTTFREILLPSSGIVEVVFTPIYKTSGLLIITKCDTMDSIGKKDCIRKFGSPPFTLVLQGEPSRKE